MTMLGFNRIFAACFFLGWTSVAVLAAPASEKLATPGLKEPVEIIKDHWGVSHIYARNENDLFFAQGYNAARDRLFQMEMWRRGATGTMAEILGPKEVNRDLMNRLFKYRGDLDKDYAVYHPHGKAIIEAFANGINAYIDMTEKNPSLLTPEFKMLGFKPVKWTPADVISRTDINRSASLGAQLNNALAIRALGTEKFKDLQYYQPANPDLTIDPAIDTSLLSRDIVSIYRLFTSPLRITPDELPPEYRSQKKVALLNSSLDDVTPMDLSARRQDVGSNNWVVGGKLTMGGFPMVVGDPHRQQEAASLRYWVHLNAPGWNVIGAGEPMNPGVSIGHNDYGAWELTTFGTSVEDLMVYDTNPANPNQYKYGDGWEDMKVIRETIAVKGGAPQTVELKYTRHGPVIHEDTAHHKAYGMRAAWLEPGGGGYVAALRLDQAKNWEEFRDASSYANVPAENYIWGDREGNIGYQAVGIAPLRPNFSGEVPVPGDGRYEWAGFLPIKDLPHILNPDKGYYNTSNNYPSPAGSFDASWPDKRALHYSWADAYRAQSVSEVLSSGKKFTVGDMEQLQNYDISIPARTIVPLLHDVTIANPLSKRAAEQLLHWNFMMDRDSVEAGIYEMFQRHLMENVRDTVVPANARSLVGNIPMTRIVAFLVAPDGNFGADPVAGRNAVLVKSLDQAMAELTKRLGADTGKWQLGAYHYAKIMHPLGEALNPKLEAQFNVGPLPRGGDSYTIDATGGTDNQVGGGSFKNIFDLENWDNSVGINSPGQSGDINDPHYRDLFPLWAKGKYFPVFFTRAKIESVAEKTSTLTPN